MIALYKVVNRELYFVQMLDMEMPRDPDKWLFQNGYDRAHTLRRGIVREITNQERRMFEVAAAKLKHEGKLPSVLDAMIGQLK